MEKSRTNLEAALSLFFEFSKDETNNNYWTLEDLFYPDKYLTIEIF